MARMSFDGTPGGPGGAPRPRAPRKRSRRRGLGILGYALAALCLTSLGLGAGALAALMFESRAPGAPAVKSPSAHEAPGRPSRPASPDASWIRNAAPFGPDSRPRLAVILVDQGRDPTLSAQAMRMPGPLTLAVAAHLENLEDRVSGVRRSGHEALVALPFDRDPPGVLSGGAIMANLPLEENLRRLRWRIGQAPSAVGILGLGGEAAPRDLKLMEAAMTEIRKAGALFVDSRAHPESLAGAAARRVGAPAGDVALRLDDAGDAESMIARLEEAEGRALVWGTAIAMAELTPQSLEAFRRWSETRSGGEEAAVALAPVSAVVRLLRSGSAETQP